MLIIKFDFQVYVGSKSTLSDGTNFSTSKNADNEVAESEVRITATATAAA